MKRYSFYHSETGVLAPDHYTTSDPADVALNIPEGHAAVEGHHDHLCKRVDLETGAVVDHVAIPTDAERAKAHRGFALASIAELEKLQPRVIREWALGKPGALQRIQDIEDRIAAHRVFL